MIGRLRGTVVDRDTLHSCCVLDVQGVGYEVFVPLRSLASLPSPPEATMLHVHTHVREEALTLYGFLSTEDRSLFRALTTVSGVGPKLAMAILSDMAGAELCAAVARGDKKRFAAVSGVGAKLAARLTLELRDKVPQAGATAELVSGAWPAAAAAHVAPPNTVAGEAVLALVSLGFPRPQAEAAVAAVVVADEDRPVEVLLRQALASLAGR